MKRKFTYLFLLLLLCHAQVIIAQDAFRTANSGNWNDPNIWESSPDGISWFPAGIAPDVTDGVVTIRNAHTVTVTATATADELVVATGGTLTVNADLTISNGPGTDLDIQTGGTVNINAVFNANGVIANAGTLNWAAGNISFTTVTLNNNASFNITGNNDVTGSGTINNNVGATITKSVGTGTTNMPISTNNAGTINVTTGTLALTSTTIVNSGTISVASGAVFNVPGSGASVTFNAGSSVTGAGLLRINGSPTNGTTINTNLSFPSTLTYESGGQINGTGSLTINGTMTWTINPIRIPLTIASGATLNSTGSGNRTASASLINAGTFNWNADADFVLNTAGTSFTNNGTFTWNAATTHQLRAFTGTLSFNNNGTFSKLGTSTTLDFASITFTNSNTGILKGVGTIITSGTGAITNNGTVAPGNSPGQLTINSSAISSNSTVEIEITAPGGPTQPGVSFDRLTLASSTDLAGSTLTIIDDDLAPVGDYVIMMTSTGTFSNTFATVNKPVNYGTVDVAGNTVTVHKLYALPVVWGEFTVKAVDQHAELVWQTLQESNTRNFVVERSKDGINYTALTTIPAKGFSSLPSTYSYTDFSPEVNAPNFYRIKQVDLDGQSEYSAVRTLKVQGVKGEYLVIQGNPVKNNVLKVNVTAGDAITIAISDMSGRVMKTQLLQPGVHSIPVSELRAGSYQITIMQEGRISGTKRIVKL